MRDSNYLSVGYATLGSLELRPPFTSPSIQSFHPSSYLSGTGQTSVPLLHLTILQRHVFLLNSCPPRLCATLLLEPLFSYVTRSFCRVPYQWLSLAPSSTRRTNLCRFIVRLFIIRSFWPLFSHCFRLSRLHCVKKVSPIKFPSVYSYQINLRARSNSTQIIFT
jgi:hypothetical protein